MSNLKRVARIAAGAILATGLLAGTVAPADAAVHDSSARASILDTGWGG